MHKYVNSANNGARDETLGSFDGGGDGRHTGVGLVDIFNFLLYRMQFSLELSCLTKYLFHCNI